MELLGTAASGLRSSQTALAASAHNVANLLTEDVRPLRTVQRSVRDGGSEAQVQQVAQPRPVDLLDETVAQLRASQQFQASLRLIETADELQGRLVDLLA